MPRAERIDVVQGGTVILSRLCTREIFGTMWKRNRGSMLSLERWFEGKKGEITGKRNNPLVLLGRVWCGIETLMLYLRGGYLRQRSHPDWPVQPLDSISQSQALTVELCQGTVRIIYHWRTSWLGVLPTPNSSYLPTCSPLLLVN